MEAAQALGVDISTLCAGKGTCGKCKIKVMGEAGASLERTDTEMKHLSKDEIQDGIRLACVTHLKESTVIYVPLRSRVGSQRLQTEGLDIPVEPNPLVRKYRVTMPKPHLHDSRADEDRLLAALTEQHGLPEPGIDFDVYRNLPVILRKANWDATAVVWKNQIIALEPGDTTGRGFGLAVDVGTTKIAGFLIDLN